MRWKRPILSTTQASCWGTNSTTVFMGRLEAQRCCAGVTHNLGALRWLCCTQTVHQYDCKCATNVSKSIDFISFSAFLGEKTWK